MSQVARPGDRVVLREKEKYDALKRLSLQHDIKAQRQYWICVFDQACYLYREFGDANPRFVISLKEAEVCASAVMPKTVCFVFSDNRTLLLTLPTQQESAKLIFL
jgi:hypothetical protein